MKGAVPYSSLPCPSGVSHFHEDPTTDVVQKLDPRARPAKADHLTLFALLGSHGQALVTVEKSPTILGRGRGADVLLSEKGLSRKHVRLFRHRQGWFAEDLGSRNGTFVDGERIRKPTQLHDGMRLMIGGNCLFRVGLSDAVEQEATVRMYESSVFDPLTQVHNRRHLDDRLEGELAYARRHGLSLSVILLDIDHFKRINDVYGHQGGDAVLRVLGGALKRLVRVEDLVARYGGEEFAIVARGLDPSNARILGERVRKLIARLVIPWDSETIAVTASLGIATFRPARPYGSVTELVAAADEALYRAKRDGRNRCDSDSSRR